MAFVQGMDLDKLEAFRTSLKENPVILGLESRSVWEGHSGRNTTHIGPYSLAGNRIDRDTRHYTFSYGAWKEVEEAIGFEGHRTLGGASGDGAGRHGRMLEQQHRPKRSSQRNQPKRDGDYHPGGCRPERPL